MKHKFVKPVERIMLFLSALLLAGSTYFIGVMSADNSKDGQIQIIYPEAIAIQNSNNVDKIDNNTTVLEDKPNSEGSNSKIVASKNGKRYYYNNCTGVNRIKPENRIYFDTKEQAEARGLTLASGCKNL